MEPSALRSTILAVCLSLGVPAFVYLGLLGTMIVAPSLQAHAIYLHKVTLTWFKDLNIPEQFGFAHHQATPFYIPTSDGERLHAWHVLPIGAYITNQDALLSQGPDGGLVEDFENTLNFRLLKENPHARLVLYFHGTSGTMASGWRPDSYRSLYAADPINTHVLTFDYRGYGLSSGWPSEPGLVTDALSVVEWAQRTAGISPERIVIYGQSLGSAVAIALVQELARTDRAPANRIHFAGLVVTATFSDIAQLTATYRIGGFIPVLSPVARIPPLFNFFTSRLHHRWDNIQRLGEFIRDSDRYHITLLHAEDDTDIPKEHSLRLFREAVRIIDGGDHAEPNAEANKSSARNTTGDLSSLDVRIEERTESKGQGGSVTVWPTPKGELRLELLKYGVHDKIMSFPVTGIAIKRAFDSALRDTSK